MTWDEINTALVETNEAQFGTGRVSVDFARRLERERDEARELNAELLAVLQSIEEFWNRDQNEAAMIGACWHAVETAHEAIAKVKGRDA